MKSKFKATDLNPCEQKIVLAMLGNSPIASSFVLEALRNYIIDVLAASKEELQAALGTGLISENLWREIARKFNAELELGVNEDSKEVA